MSAEPLLTMKPEVAGGPMLPAQAGSSTPQSVFWFTFWLAIALTGTKAALLRVREFPFESLSDYLHNLAFVAQEDILFAAIVGMTAQAALRLSRGRQLLAKNVWAILVIFAIICVIYAIVSVQIFAYLQSPLTYRLLYLASDIKNMRSSVGAFISPTLLGAVVIVPGAYVVLAFATHRLVQPRRTTLFRIGQIGSFVLLGAYLLFVRQSLAVSWGDRNDRRMAENPHWTLAVSLVTEFFGDGTVQLGETFDPADFDDFRVASERAADPPPVYHPDPPRNVIVLVMESTGTQYLSVYGSEYDTTPRLKEEAAHSMVFSNFYCHVGLTANCVVALALSIYPGMTWREYTLEHPRLPGTTLAELLRVKGYRTAFIHNGDLDYTNQRGFLENRGYDSLWDYRDLACGPPDFDYFSWGVEDRCLVDGILKWIDQDRDRPFAMLAWTIQAHHPYTLLPKDVPEIDFFRGNVPPGDDYNLGLYLNVLREMDRQIGRLFDGLRARGIADDTLVVITGDHGEAFGFPHDTFGHGGKIYQENVNVPFILWNPQLFSGQRSDVVAAQVDLNPTVAHVLGIAPAPAWQGHSVFDPHRPPRAYFYAANDDYLFGVREENWKYTYNATTGRQELYDLKDDPGEQRNIAAQHPDRCQRLRQRIAAWLAYEQRHLAKLHAANSN